MESYFDDFRLVSANQYAIMQTNAPNAYLPETLAADAHTPK